MLNKSAEYALRVVTLIAGRPVDRASHAAELAKVLGVPANYLSKILHQLAAAGVLTSRRGRQGGFRLVGAPDEITLATVVAPFDGLATYRSCFLGNAVCGDRNACAAHARWKPIADSAMQLLRETTVGALTIPDRRSDRTPERARKRGGSARRVAPRDGGDRRRR